jgi:hypothetical protein
VFVRKKKNKSGLISIQVIDKSSRAYRLLKTIGSSDDSTEINRLYEHASSRLKTKPFGHSRT